jgi:hypothetical protein
MANQPLRGSHTFTRSSAGSDHRQRRHCARLRASLPAPSPGLLLIIDGDSFAHRAYHALPKSIRRRGDPGGGAIVGFANFLLRLYETELPRAVLVGWGTG